MLIESLAGHQHLVPLLAEWHFLEWGHLYPADVWNLEIATAEFEAMAASLSTDLTWVAFDGEARRAEDVLGSVSLMASDDLVGFEHLAPWLSSMFVAPAARGRGVASALVDCLLAAARDAGHDTVYLFTAGQEGFWSAQGWTTIGHAETAGHLATVMSRSVQ
jgi:GNAT superfamily N-acetyltransferase